MLIKCPECELQVSDKAIACPHCGYPMRTGDMPKRRKLSRRKRLPNGFGQIDELKGRNLRKPFRVRVTVGKTTEGRPIAKILKPEGYFASYNDAYAALVEYNKAPYELESSMLTYELYEKWSTDYFKSLKSDSSVRSITSAWAYCKPIYNMRAKDLRARHIKGCIDDAPSPNLKGRIKSLMNIMLDYAVEYEIVEKNYARTFTLGKDVKDDIEEAKRSHIAFTDKEMELLWKNENNELVGIVLIQCYSGWRPQELGLIELKDVNFDNWTFKGGMKTEAGIDRVVPIHKNIRHLVKIFYDLSVARGGSTLFTMKDGTRLTYDKYSNRFNKLMKDLEFNPEHRSHDPRKTFVTMAKRADVNEYAIKKIVGHTISDITEKVYTERDPDWLTHEINKI